jgi:hypothetical protein
VLPGYSLEECLRPILRFAACEELLWAFSKAGYMIGRLNMHNYIDLNSLDISFEREGKREREKQRKNEREGKQDYLLGLLAEEEEDADGC